MGTTFIRAHTPYVSFFCSAIGARSPNAPQFGKQRERAKLWRVHTASWAIRTQKGKFASETNNRQLAAQVLDGRNFLGLYTICGIRSKSIFTNLPYFYLFPSSISISSDVRSHETQIDRKNTWSTLRIDCAFDVCVCIHVAPSPSIQSIRLTSYASYVRTCTISIPLNGTKSKTRMRKHLRTEHVNINEFLSIAPHLCKLISMARIAMM